MEGAAGTMGLLVGPSSCTGWLTRLLTRPSSRLLPRLSRLNQRHPYLSRPPGSCGTARVFESWILHPGDLVSPTGPPDLCGRGGVRAEVVARTCARSAVGGERERHERGVKEAQKNIKTRSNSRGGILEYRRERLPPPLVYTPSSHPFGPFGFRGPRDGARRRDHSDCRHTSSAPPSRTATMRVPESGKTKTHTSRSRYFTWVWGFGLGLGLGG